MKQLLKIEEVAVLIGVSVQTINIWYRFKRANPDNDYAKMLPDFIQEGARQTRYWYRTDIQKLVDFKRSIPRGCKGNMGMITQRYVKNGKKNI